MPHKKRLQRAESEHSRFFFRHNGVAKERKEATNQTARRDLTRDTAHRPPVAATAPDRRIQPSRTVAQVVGVATIADRRGPVVAVRAEIVQRRVIDVARPSEYTPNKRKLRDSRPLFNPWDKKLLIELPERSEPIRLHCAFAVYRGNHFGI